MDIERWHGAEHNTRLSLKQVLKDFLSIEHWVKKRVVTCAAIYAHEWTSSSWYYLFRNVSKP